MIGYFDIDPAITSYATRENAVKAAEKKLTPWADIDVRVCNVLIVRNEAGRYVPLVHNIHPDHLHQIIHCGLFVMN